MDLRNRDSLETVKRSVGEITGKVLNTHGEEELDAEIQRLSNSLLEKEALQRQKAMAPKLGTFRLHVFDLEGTLRVSGEGFSHFVSRVDVSSGHQSLGSWIRGNEEVDGFTVGAAGLHGDEVKLVVSVEYQNCLYRVPCALSGAGNDVYMTFPQLFKTICGYIKQKGLSSNDDPSYFMPDAVLSQLLFPAAGPVSFASLLEALRNRFKAPGPFTIVHKIGSEEQVFDITVRLPAQTGPVSVLEEAERRFSANLTEVDRQIADIVADLPPLAGKVAHLNNLASNPSGYLAKILQTPSGTPKKIESAGNIDYFQMATCHEFYKQPWAVAAAAYVVNEQRKEASSNK